MKPADLARLHAAAFTSERPWAAAEFAALLENRHTALLTRPHGFALTRTVAGESELLTLAVDPAHQRKGIARALVTDWLGALAGLADRAYLEVAADNDPARRLYLSTGFAVEATRPAYYRRTDGPPADAMLMTRAVTLGQSAPRG